MLLQLDPPPPSFLRVSQAFEQWKRLVDVVCRCEEALTHPSTLRNVSTPALRACYSAVLGHLKVLPSDLFTDDLSKNNFLRRALHRLFRTARRHRADLVAAHPAEVQPVIAAMEQLCRRRFGFGAPTCGVEAGAGAAAGAGAGAGAEPTSGGGARAGRVVTAGPSGPPVFLPPDSDDSDDDDLPVVVDLTEHLDNRLHIAASSPA